MQCVYDYGCESPARSLIVTQWLSWEDFVINNHMYSCWNEEEILLC